jgi:hypothetical protein
MMIPVTSLISNLRKRPPVPVQTSLHGMMAGLYQNLFLNQWGAPEFQVSLERLAGFFKLDYLFLDIKFGEEDYYSVWIYEKRNKILFFKNKKLLFHFRWDEFKEKWKRPKEEVDSWLIRRSRVRMVTSVSYVN